MGVALRPLIVVGVVEYPVRYQGGDYGGPDQRRHERRRLQLPSHPQVAEETPAQNHRRNMGRDYPILRAHTGFLTVNSIVGGNWFSA